MIINGQNVLKKMDDLIGKAVRIITVQEEELYGAGYIGIVKNIQKRHWGKGFYDVYDIVIDLKGFEELNRRHDICEFDGKAYVDTEFYTGEITYRICTKYNKYELEFEDDLEVGFFEIVNYTAQDSYNLELQKYKGKIYLLDEIKYTPNRVDNYGVVTFEQVLFEFNDSTMLTGGRITSRLLSELREMKRL